MKRFLCVISACMAIAVLTSCGGQMEKNISVVVREQGSGTREAFDRVVSDGTHFLEEQNENGKKVYNTTKTAIQQTKTGTVLSTVAFDKNAIGYISIGSLNDTVSVVKVGGIYPSEQAVLSGEYKIQRPFVLMTKKGQSLTPRTSDFMSYLRSEAAAVHSEAAGCIFLSEPHRRANEGASAIAVGAFKKKTAIPEGDKIVIRGSTSVERFISSAAKGYCELYGASPEELFDIQLEGSSVGRKAVENDTRGNVIGLSSAYVVQDNIESFNVCLDAIAVVVNKQNTSVVDLSLSQLYDIFSGRIKKFSELK